MHRSRFVVDPEQARRIREEQKSPVQKVMDRIEAVPADAGD